mgnify:FL=1
MGDIAKQSDAVICNGGHNTVMTILLAGKPLIILPSFLEQVITGMRVEESGAGLVANSRAMQRQPDRMLRKLLTNKIYTQRAAGFAKKYRDFDAKAMLDRAASRCIELLS